MCKITLVIFAVILCYSNCLRILFLLPYDGSSHHGYYAPLIEELVKRNHELTVVNYHSFQNMTNLKQISLATISEHTKRRIIMNQYYANFPDVFKDIFVLTENVHAVEKMAKTNCERIFSNPEVLELIKNGKKFDVFIIEQFYSDCGLAWANSINAPVIGITAHILMPWTYSRLGVPNNPAFVPNRIGKVGLWARIKAVFLNFYSNVYYWNRIQKVDHAIASRVLPGTQDLESIARKISLVMVNQYFPLTGSRIYSPNVVEIGGMHVREIGIQDQDLLNFLDTADLGVVYISFGSVACGLPDKKIQDILKVIERSNQRFVWKLEPLQNMTLPGNLMIRHWLPQVDVLCHQNVIGFVTHSGMLSSIEAMHCGVPVISVPIFGDQFANAQSATENGLGVTLDFDQLGEDTLKRAMDEILQESFQSRAKYLSTIWSDRPRPPLDSAIFWIEYIAKHQGVVKLSPPTVDLPLYQYLMLDVWFVISCILLLIGYASLKIVTLCLKARYYSFWKKLD